MSKIDNAVRSSADETFLAWVKERYGSDVCERCRMAMEGEPDGCPSTILNKVIHTRYGLKSTAEVTKLAFNTE